MSNSELPWQATNLGLVTPGQRGRAEWSKTFLVGKYGALVSLGGQITRLRAITTS